MIGLTCATLSCDGFGDNKFTQSFATLPNIGYRYVEFNCWHASDITPRNIRWVRSRCEDTGLIPAAIYSTSFGGSTHHEINKDGGHKLRLIDAAVELGCRRVVATGARRNESGGIEAIIKILKDVVPYAEEKGVLICLENHAGNNLEYISDYEMIFEAIDSQNLGLCVDTGHFEASGVSLDEVIDRLFSKINHIHVKETSEVGVENFVKFGEGVTDNVGFVKRMSKLGYHGFVTVELALEDKTNLVEDLTRPYEMFHPFEHNN